MEDQLVSYETAKLAHDKGIKINTRLHYSSTTKVTSVSYNEISAPTQSLLQRCLRETHNIHCNANVNFYNKSKKLGYYYSIDRFDTFDIHDGKDYDLDQLELIGDQKGFDTYEEALEVGLNKSLSLLP